MRLRSRAADNGAVESCRLGENGNNADHSFPIPLSHLPSLTAPLSQRFLHFTHQITNRAGELNSDELERIVTIMQNPAQFKIPNWFLNRQRDMNDGKNSHVLSNQIDQKMREDLERLKKIRSHRGLRHHWGLRVRGQHTKTT